MNPEARSIVYVSPELSDMMRFDARNDDVIIYKNQGGSFSGLWNYGILNLKISWRILTRSKEVDAFLFFHEWGLFLPMVCAKLCNRRVLWLLPSSLKSIEHTHGFFNRFLFLQQSLSYTIADKLVVYSPNLVAEWQLERYRHKILIAYEHFIGTDTFAITTPFLHRPRLIGYIGRFHEEKGILNFIKALPAVLNTPDELRVLIGGDGPQKESIVAILQENGLTARIDLTGWIFQQDLPLRLNTLRLLVIPSYTEGLPNIMLEAMACGTPVAATPVGAIPDIIKDGETGFIMENNSPECIAKTISRALNDPNVETIALNARLLVQREFAFDISVKQWKRILETI
jgi:glycosyltransferase involved in cell wall biosynthesis